MDITVDDNGHFSIYECKVDKTTIQDVAQLVMYYVIAVVTGTDVHEGVLVAREHSKGVKNLVAIFNKLKDPRGKLFNLRLSSWVDEGVPYDENVKDVYSI